jgi:hypothetical protein
MTWDDVCAIALTLPHVVRGTYHGYPALRVKTRFLARLSDDHANVEFKSLSPIERRMLLESRPHVFHIPADYRGSSIFARLSALDENTARDLLAQRWLKVAPKGAVLPSQAR